MIHCGDHGCSYVWLSLYSHSSRGSKKQGEEASGAGEGEMLDVAGSLFLWRKERWRQEDVRIVKWRGRGRRGRERGKEELARSMEVACGE
ncbi:hypothetical protein L1887_15170 [Cichorium endivia]|nr:hypothetical protein L1887_15170 [Cichorium endivia]